MSRPFKRKNLLKRLKQLISKVHKLEFIFLVLAIVPIFLLYSFSRREERFINVLFKVTDESVLYANAVPSNDFADSFKVGDEEKNEVGNTIAKITDVTSYNIDPKHKVILFRADIKAIFNPLKATYSFKGRQISFGESIPFSFSKVKVTANVYDFPGFRNADEVKISKRIVTARSWNESRYFSDVSGVAEFNAFAVQPGQEIKGADGNVLIRVLDVRVVPAKRVVLSQRDMPIEVNDPVLKDVTYVLEVRTTEIAGSLYAFEYIPLKINELIPLNFRNITLYPLVTQISDE
jgi:hypothetical protein